MPTLYEVFVSGLKAQQAGAIDEAARAYRWVIANDPNPPITARIMLASLMPVVYRSLDDLHRARDKVTSQIQALVDEGVRLDLTNQWAPPNFMSAYFGLDDRPLQQLRAKLYHAPPDLPAPPARKASARIRLGLASTYFKDHTIGKLNLGVVQNLDRSKFEVTVVSLGPARDAMAQSYRQAADHYVELPQTPKECRHGLAQLGLDAIFYTDIGMNPITFSLGFYRIAGLQCVTWGHPVTTGIPNIDCFISSQHLDTEAGQAYYTEELIRLPNLVVCYDRPPLPNRVITRSQMGLPEDCTIYGCLQSLQKIHPSFDPMLGEILRQDPKGVILLLAGQIPMLNAALRERFAQTIPDVAHRIAFAPRQDREGFLALNQLCDLMIDPLHFGGGNTSWEALSLGVPIVTLPSAFLRGRITYALYQAMGMDDLIAKNEQDYIRLAVAVGTHPALREELKARIRALCPRILNQTSGIREFEAFLVQRLRTD